MGFLRSSIQTPQQYMELGHISLSRTMNHNHYRTLPITTIITHCEPNNHYPKLCVTTTTIGSITSINTQYQ